MTELNGCPFCKTDEGVLLCMSRPTFESFTKNGKPAWVYCTCVTCALTVRSKESMDYDDALNDLTKRWNGLRYAEND